MGILWHKSIDAVSVEGITSDRLCAVRFSIHDGVESLITVIGVYLPCADQGMECYTNHLIELERIINESSVLGKVIVLGDFNAHLGTLGGVRGRGPANTQGVLVSELSLLQSQCSVSWQPSCRL